MKRSPVTLLVCVLLLGTGAAMYPPDSRASTGNHGSSYRAGNPSAGLRSGARTVSQEHKTATAGMPVPPADITFRDPACQHEIAGEAYMDTLPAGRSCSNTPDTQQRFAIRLGRRIGTSNDILGEFDGVRVDYRPRDGLTLNGIAGYPVFTAEDVFNSERQLFGISAATNSVANTWDLNGYLVEQQSNGQVVDRSMGGAIRYLQPGRSMLVYLDYDPVADSVGTLLASGALSLPWQTTLSATVDFQKRPLPGLQQKFLARSMTAMDGWDWILPNDRLAVRTAGDSNEVGLLAVDLSHALSQRIRLRGNVVLLDVMNARDAAATAGSSEYYYQLKITGSDLMAAGDRSKLDLRRAVTESGRSYTATFDTRHVIKRFWNFISQLRADYHKPAQEGRASWVASPKVKMEYRPNRQYGFHIEAGGNVTYGASAGANASRPSYFVSLGYQARF
ncbi:MAG: hypothetical protein PVI50_04910 [Gammaproteobacteria bacterium]|jgi:hypothetical protein